MAVTALYRLNGLEVLKISPKGQTFADRDPAYFGVLTDPTLPDGNKVRATNADGTMGPLRVFGLAQIAVPGTNTCRLATQPEIDAWAAAEGTDDKALDAHRVGELFSAHPQWRKAFKALLKRILGVTNAHAAVWNDYKAAVAAATSLADLKASVAALPTLSTFTLAQAITALLNDIDPED